MPGTWCTKRRRRWSWPPSRRPSPRLEPGGPTKSLSQHSLDSSQAEQKRIQLERYLDRFEIEDAKIPGVGPGRKQTLESFGIETAADITRSNMEGVPGFGPSLQSKLLAWRSSIEARFVFDPRRAVDPQDVARVEHEILAERRRVQTALAKALAELKQARGQIVATRQQLKAQVEAVQKEYVQALADFEAAKR